MNVKLATFMILVPSAVIGAQPVLASPSYSRHDAQLTSSAAPERREARSFGDIDRRNDGSWAHVAARDYDDDAGPFTREEARQLRSVWSTIREAENFHDINWHSLGLARAPGDRDARRFMAEDWGSLRRAAQFDDIDWRTEYRRH